MLKWLLFRFRKTSIQEIIYKLWVSLAPLLLKTICCKQKHFNLKENLNVAFIEEEKEDFLQIVNNYLNSKWKIFEKPVKTPVTDWNKCPVTGYLWPQLPVYKLSYKGNDPKYVWELNRFHHIIPFAYVYSITGDIEYYKLVVSEIRSWIKQNPYGYGINWKSNIEIAIRMLNWFLFFLISRKNIPDDIACAIDTHLNHLHYTYSLFSSSNNHLTAELSAVMFVSSFSLKRKEKYFWRAFNLLKKHISRLILMDGSNAEQSFYYHLHVLEHLLFARYSLLNVEEEKYYDFLTDLYDRGLDFIQSLLLYPSFKLPVVGDTDGGRFTGLDFHISSQEYARIFFTDSSIMRLMNFKSRVLSPLNKEKVYNYPDGGYFVYRNNGYLIIFDYGNLGYPPVYAHGHMDLFSIVIYKDDQPVIPDSGIPGYMSQLKDKINYYKGGLGHNIVYNDKIKLANLIGYFLWDHDIYPEFKFFKDANRLVLKGSIKYKGFKWDRVVEFKENLIVIKDSGKVNKGKTCLLWHLLPDFKENIYIDHSFEEADAFYSPFVGIEEKIKLFKVCSETAEFKFSTKILLK